MPRRRAFIDSTLFSVFRDAGACLGAAIDESGLRHRHFEATERQSGGTYWDLPRQPPSALTKRRPFDGPTRSQRSKTAAQASHNNGTTSLSRNIISPISIDGRSLSTRIEAAADWEASLAPSLLPSGNGGQMTGKGPQQAGRRKRRQRIARQFTHTHQLLGLSLTARISTSTNGAREITKSRDELNPQCRQRKRWDIFRLR